MAAEWVARGHPCSENTAARLAWEHGIQAKASRRRVRATDSNHRLPVAANRPARAFGPTAPNTAWPAGITYLPTREGWRFLAVVEGLFRRMIVGWSTAETMERRWVVDALHLALGRRRPAAGLLAHSDRGGPYASDHYQRALAAAGIACRMSEVGQCWDNAPVERFFGRLKTDLAPEAFETRHQARAERFEYLDVFYNRVRLHSPLGLVSPTEFERAYHLPHP